MYVMRVPDGRNVSFGKNSGITGLGQTRDAQLGLSYCYSYEEQWQPKNISVILRMYQFNLDGNDDFIYKEYWNRYSNHFLENM